MKQKFDQGRRKKSKTKSNVVNGDLVKNQEEIAGLLTNDKNDIEKKDESEEVDDNDCDDLSPLKRYDLGSKWKNMETVFGSSMILWFFPMDWNDDELYKRQTDASYSFDRLPWRKKANKIIKSVIGNTS